MKDIRVSHQRNLRSNWLIFEPGDRFLLGLKNKYAYEIGMIENNKIGNFIKPVIKRTDGGMAICYDISSLQPLSRIMEVRAVKVDEIRNFIIEIISAVKALEEFLLEASSITLNPEFIFSDLDFKNFKFIYMPSAEGNIEELNTLLEYILNKMDKDDRDGWKMVYDMLQESRKKYFVIYDLERIIDDAKYIENKIEMQSEEVLSEKLSTGITDSIEGKENKKRQFNIFSSIFKSNKTKDNEESGESEYFEKLFEGYEPKGGELCLNEEKKSFRVDEIQSNTVLLTEIKKTENGRWLRDLNGRNDICIAYLPFIIGKQERICDFVLDVEGVSRMHLQFFEQNGELFAKDLNSRNGTRINGKQLENEENMRLYNGDEVNICGKKYKLEIIK